MWRDSLAVSNDKSAPSQTKQLETIPARFDILDRSSGERSSRKLLTEKIAMMSARQAKVLLTVGLADEGSEGSRWDIFPGFPELAHSHKPVALVSHDRIAETRAWSDYLLIAGHPRPSLRKGIMDRVAELRSEAAEENEPFNEASVEALISFCVANPITKAPTIFLVPNGNVRAVWQRRASERIALQFFDDGRIQHVVIRQSANGVEQDMGEHTAENVIHSVVIAMGLRSLWNG